jgi:hypothetical protein
MVAPALRSSLTESQLEVLLRRVCVDLGICLTPDTYDQLVTAPSGDAASLTDAIFEAEGMSPQSADRALYAKVKSYVDDALSGVTSSDDA